ncbi:SusC/RagA family TonB-linked outer membrane protein [Adhaeribacter swui]|uniref:SusC/RagA family TonB-linked outer membrane protein n=1 Tax=Adhaeribacter swui TaxID=2086471 RepID=A0A7G7G3J6_9BACT|nr:SusC/RagA family TonB-linked outer membrane protein [Adhaeribacter swui]QNF31730.1 SusC/RagA family TonB-linked outer membrane protein [Adhaeribacter swui]
MKQYLLSFALFSLFPLTALSHNSSFLLSNNWFKGTQDTTLTIDSVNLGNHSLFRSQFTGAISTISQKQLQQVAVISVDHALKGQVAGVQVTQNSGMPGAAAAVRVRGISTLFNSAEPLYVLDGVPFIQTLSGNANSFLSILNSININDIASIEILKDAGAAAIYGTRASNGVVLITTRRGQAQSNQVTFDTYFGLQEAPRQIPLLNATEYAELINKALKQESQAPKYSAAEVKAFGKGTNWQEEVFRTAPLLNNQLSYTGGTQAHRFFASAGYLNQQGIVIQSGLRRYNFRLNYDGQIGKNLKISISSLISTLKNQPTDPNSIYYTLTAPPVFKPNDTTNHFRNPIRLLRENTYSEEGKLLWANFFAEYQIKPGLLVKAQYGVNEIKQESRQIFHARLSNDIRYTKINYSSKTPMLEATLRFHKSWQKHTFFLLSGFAGQQLENSYINKVNLSRSGNGFEEYSEEGKRSKNKFFSYFGQFHYSFNNRYFISASVRKDGSSQFSPPERYTALPAIAAAWQVIHQQQSKQIVQSLKFRTSYGLTAYGQFSGNDMDHTNSGFIDPTIHPEVTKQINLGADLQLLSNHIQLTTDLYQRTTSDAIVLIPAASSAGYSYFRKNLAGLKNQGLEISINSHNLKGAVTWNSSFTFAANKNIITDLDGLKIVLLNTRNRTFLYSEGQSIGAINGLKTDGLYQSQDQLPNSYTLPGDVKYRNLDKSGNLNSNQTLLGSTHPAFTYSFNNDLSFKNFELNLFLQGVQGDKIYNETLVHLNNFYTTGSDNTDNGSRRLLQHWSPQHTNTSIPRLNGSYSNTVFSDQYIENGSFLRVRQLTFAYNLPPKFTLSNKMLLAKVYISGQNLFTFTRYSGYDPESGGLPIAEQGLDAYNYPIPRTYLAGIRITW